MTENKDEYLTFEQALEALKLKEEELKRLVSEGEIRAFRQGETMKLRKTDVEGLRGELSGGALAEGEVVDLGETAPELVFEDESDTQAGMATEEITEVETIVDEGEPTAVEEAVEEEAVEEEPVEPEEEEEQGIREGVPLLVVSIAASIVLLLVLPAMVTLSTGFAGSVAERIAGLFGGGAH